MLGRPKSKSPRVDLAAKFGCGKIFEIVINIMATTSCILYKNVNSGGNRSFWNRRKFCSSHLNECNRSSNEGLRSISPNGLAAERSFDEYNGC